jgi:hypothetical protein
MTTILLAVGLALAHVRGLFNAVLCLGALAREDGGSVDFWRVPGPDHVSK